jgi:transketolase
VISAQEARDVTNAIALSMDAQYVPAPASSVCDNISGIADADAAEPEHVWAVAVAGSDGDTDFVLSRKAVDEIRRTQRVGVGAKVCN